MDLGLLGSVWLQSLDYQPDKTLFAKLFLGKLCVIGHILPGISTHRMQWLCQPLKQEKTGQLGK